MGETEFEATLEPRLVLKGDSDTPYIFGEFYVPAYQRGYRWGPEEVCQLLDDIAANASRVEEGGESPPDYYLQPIVVQARGDGQWELVDGQQRLTTLFLITKYISTKISEAGVDYRLTYETREESRQFLKDLDPALRDTNVDYYHMARAYDAIVEWFEDPGPAGLSAADLHTALSSWVYVIWYEAPIGTDTTELFTRLNRDRIPLTDSELIKALVLSHSSGAGHDRLGRQREIAAQWDSFERDLRDVELWAFLTGSTKERSTHIDFLFESMTPAAGRGTRPRQWTFTMIQKDVESRPVAAFWKDVVERHGLLIGWFHDRELYHRIGYLVASGVRISDLIEASRAQTHSAFRDDLLVRTMQRLNLTAADVSLLRYDKAAGKCTDVLLLMNVQTVLLSRDPGSRFSFHAYANDGWSLEHIHAQHSQDFKKEPERRDCLRAHLKKMDTVAWSADREAEVNAVRERITAHLALPEGETDDGFDLTLESIFALFSTPGAEFADGELHGLGNLALLQREFNSTLNNAVFALKRERIIEIDTAGAYLLPCTRNVFLKYYTASADEQLSLWGPQDEEAYYTKLIEKVEAFLVRNDDVSGEVSE